MKKTILIFSGLALAFLTLIKLSEFSLSGNASASGFQKELVIIIIGAVFIFLGVVLSKMFQRSPSSPNTEAINEQAIKSSGLSKREYEILELMAQGLSNKQIGEQLYISESTVKTHVSNVLSKLNSSRRTQAVQIARDLNILT